MINQQTNTPSNLNRQVLLQAWAQLSVCDKTASNQKKEYVQRRKIIIAFTTIATIASVLTGIIGQNNVIANIFGIVAIALPTLGAALMNDTVRFTGTTSWIKYRYTAEMMRMHIYLYRMKAGVYAAEPPDLMDDKLFEMLTSVRGEMNSDQVLPASIQEPQGEEAIVSAIKEANSTTPADDGLTEISLENYIQWRIDSQRSWYDSKVLEDFKQLKSYARAAQAALLIGALLSALTGYINIQFITLIAATNAISVFLNGWSDISMIGKTYSLFRITSMRLGDEKLRWSSIENNTGLNRETASAEVAQRVENILQWEREEWYELVLQLQADTDKTILGDLAKLTQRAEEAQKKS